MKKGDDFRIQLITYVAGKATNKGRSKRWGEGRRCNSSESVGYHLSLVGRRQQSTILGEKKKGKTFERGEQHQVNCKIK